MKPRIEPAADRQAGPQRPCLSCCRPEASCRHIFAAPYLKKTGSITANFGKIGVGEGIEPFFDPVVPCPELRSCSATSCSHARRRMSADIDSRDRMISACFCGYGDNCKVRLGLGASQRSKIHARTYGGLNRYKCHKLNA
jgi:hypothetical protein